MSIRIHSTVGSRHARNVWTRHSRDRDSSFVAKLCCLATRRDHLPAFLMSTQRVLDSTFQTKQVQHRRTLALPLILRPNREISLACPNTFDLWLKWRRNSDKQANEAFDQAKLRLPIISAFAEIVRTQSPVFFNSRHGAHPPGAHDAHSPPDMRNC